MASAGKAPSGAAGQPIEQGARQAEEGSVEDDARHDGARRAAPGAISSGKPLVERQETELGPESDEEEEAHSDLCGLGKADRCAIEIGQLQRCDPHSQNRDRKDERDGADFEQRQHEEDGSTARRLEVLANNHHRAAEAHQFPRDQERSAVLKSEHAEGSKKAHCGAEQPAARSACRGRGERASEPRGQEAETHKPKAFRIDAEGDRFTDERIRKDDRRTSGWQADDRRQYARRDSDDEENAAQH